MNEMRENAQHWMARSLGSLALAAALTLGFQVTARANETAEATPEAVDAMPTAVFSDDSSNDSSSADEIVKEDGVEQGEPLSSQDSSDLVSTVEDTETGDDGQASGETDAPDETDGTLPEQGAQPGDVADGPAGEKDEIPISSDEELGVSDDALAEEQSPVTPVETDDETTPTSGTAQSIVSTVEKRSASVTAGEDQPAGATSTTSTTNGAPKGIIAIETGLSYGIVADVKGGSTSNKANVQIYRSNDTTAQRWRLEFHGNTCYVVNVKSGKVLDVVGGKAAKGANVQLYKANGSKAQLWIPERLANGSWVLRSALNRNYVLDVAGGTITNGTNLRLWTSNGSKAQTFWFREANPDIKPSDRVIADGTYVISTSLTANGALDVKGASTNKGTNVQLYNNNGSNAQRFYVTYADGYYTFQNVLSGLALDLCGASPVAGANVQLWSVNHSKAQQWSVIAVGDGSYRLINRASGLVLDLSGGKTANGTNVRGYYGNGSHAQSWVFTSTTMLANGFYILEDSTGNVFDISGGSTEAGAAVQHHASNRSMAQQFYVDNKGDHEVEVRNVGSAKYLSDSGTGVVQSSSPDTWMLVWNGNGIAFTNGTTYLGFTAAGKATMSAKSNAATILARPTSLLDTGYYQFKNLVGTVLDTKGQSKTQANAVTNSASDSVSQIWYVKARGNGNYSLINLKSGLALEVASTSTTNGVLARQATYTGAQKQLWKIAWDQTNGGLVLVNAVTGLALDVAGGSSKAGISVQQYRANSSQAQSWHLVDKTIPAIIERIAQVSEHFANHEVHGYSIPNRGCGTKETITLTDGTKVKVTNSDVDCSEMVRQCINAGADSNLISYLDTRIEDAVLKALGFVRIAFSADKVKRGDILWVSGHTGICVGDNKQADAHQDEYGNLTGPNKGDQTSHEVEVRNLRTTWTYIYRLVA